MAERYIQAHLVDASHKLPVPGTARFFSTEPEGENVDSFDSFWQMLLADGSLKPGVRAEAAPPAAPEPESSPEPAPSPAPVPDHA